MPKFAALWGQLIVFMGSFIAVTNPPVYQFADFLNDNLAKIVGVALAWLAFTIMPVKGSDTGEDRHLLAHAWILKSSPPWTFGEKELKSLTFRHVVH